MCALTIIMPVARALVLSHILLSCFNGPVKNIVLKTIHTQKTSGLTYRFSQMLHITAYMGQSVTFLFSIHLFTNALTFAIHTENELNTLICGEHVLDLQNNNSDIYLGAYYMKRLKNGLL